VSTVYIVSIVYMLYAPELVVLSLDYLIYDNLRTNRSTFIYYRLWTYLEPRDSTGSESYEGCVNSKQ